MRRLLILLCGLLFPVAVSLGQLRIGEKTHTRLIVPDHLEFIVDTPELIVDTLIMDDRSTLKFTCPFTKVVIRHALIGKKCKWLGKGIPAGNYENQRMDGASLDIEITFKELAQLTIDVSGGLGYRGNPGSPGAPGANGQTLSNGSPGGNGGPGGDGGDGGNINLRYRTLGESVVFTKARRNSVVIIVDGGSGGPGGNGGPGGPGGIPTGRTYEANGRVVNEINGQRGIPGPSGNSGEAGQKGNPGKLRIIEVH